MWEGQEFFTYKLGLGEQIQPDILEVFTYETDSFQPYFLSLNACPYSLDFHL